MKLFHKNLISSIQFHKMQRTVLKKIWSPLYFKYHKNDFRTMLKSSSVLFSVASSFFFANYLIQDISKTSYCSEDSKSQLESNNQSFEEFSDEKFNKSLANKEDIIILVDPDKYIAKFQEEIFQFLRNTQTMHKFLSKRGLKILVLKVQNEQDQEQFKEKYNVTIGEDTILLLRNKYLKTFFSFGAEHYFNNQDFIIKYFRKIQKLSISNYGNFVHSLTQFNSETRIILCNVSKKSKDFTKIRNRFAVLSYEESLGENKNIHFLAVTDPSVFTQLNIENPLDGEIFILGKATKYNHNHITANLENQKVNIMRSNKTINSSIQEILNAITSAYKKEYIFSSPSFDNIPSKYTLIFEVDQNRIEKYEYNHCIKIFSEFHDDIIKNNPDLLNQMSIVRVNRRRQHGPYRIYLRDDEQAMKEMIETQKTDFKTKISFGGAPPSNYHSFTYEFPLDEELNISNLKKFLSNIKEGKALEYFKSQPIPNYPKYSKKLVSSTFKQEIIENKLDHALFFYSKNCHACKHYGGFFEELALANHKLSKLGLQFNRMNTDLNQLNCFPNYHYTPVFMVIRKEEKKYPFIYKMKYFQPNLLKEFIDLTIEQELIPREIERMIFLHHKEAIQIFNNWKQQ